MILSAGGFSLTVFGIMLSAALAAMYLSILVVRNYSRAFNAKHVSRYMLIALPTAFILSRAAYCVININEFQGNAVEMLFVWRGGFSLTAALIGFIVAAAAYARIKKLNTVKLLNVISIGLALFAAVIRLSEGASAAGKPFSSGFPKIFTYTDIYNTARHMPSVYEGVFALCAFAYLVNTFRKIKKPDGLFARWIVLYCACLLPFEGLRDGSPMLDMLVSVACMAVATLIYSYKLTKTDARLRFALIRAFMALASLAGIVPLHLRSVNFINLELNCVWLFALSALSAAACLSLISNCEKRVNAHLTCPSRAAKGAIETHRQ